ncbi:MAG: hypothetical protein WCJ30_13770 [Deltaproteobacteria bacterium]
MRIPPTGTPGREKLARLLLLPLLLVILCGAAAANWRSSWSVDNRTYLEMIDGVRHHGLPYTENGGPAAVRQFPELRARWNRVQDGRLWGTLAPAFPYLALPAYLVGGAAGVTKMNIGLFVIVALAVFGLGRGLTGDPLAGTASAYVAIATAPSWGASFDTSPYSFAIMFLALAAYLAMRALDGTAGSSRARRYAFGAGLSGGMSVASHLLGFPGVATLVALLALLPGSGDLPITRKLPPSLEPLRAWLPTRAGSLRRGAWAFLGLALTLLFQSAFNHARFHTWNPITYGPCEWHSCVETGLDKQGVGQMVKYAAPVLAWAAAWIVSAWVVRRSRVGLVLVSATAVLALAPTHSTLHAHAVGLGAMAWGFVVDLSQLEIGNGFVRHPDGLGVFLGPYAVKSLLQCTPALILAPLGVFAVTPARRPIAVLIGLPCLAMIVSLALRANLPTAFGLGFPFLSLRYVYPMIPLLAVLAVAAVHDRGWEAWHTLVAVLLACALGFWISRKPDDNPVALRFILLRGTLLVGAVSALIIARPTAPHRAALAVVALVFGLGGAVTLGRDLRSMVQIRNDSDSRMLADARLTPQRFALVGWPPDIDPVLALRTQRDLVYADLYESQNWANFRVLIDRWTAEERPIYAMFPVASTMRSPWPQVRFDPVDRTLGLYRISLR